MRLDPSRVEPALQRAAHRLALELGDCAGHRGRLLRRIERGLCCGTAYATEVLRGERDVSLLQLVQLGDLLAVDDPADLIARGRRAGLVEL